MPPLEHLQVRVPAMPEHTSAGGDIFGGWIMAQVDVAGSVPAVRRSRGRVVTVAVKEFLFLQPVFVGDMVSIFAWIEGVGTSSMTVVAEVYVERNPHSPETVQVASARLVYVAVDDQGRPRAVEAD